MGNRRLIPMLFILVVIGLVNFYSVAKKPRFETFQTIDVVQLIVTGMCFGVALGLLVLFLRRPRSS
jgi:hypothetical protein